MVRSLTHISFNFQWILVEVCALYSGCRLLLDQASSNVPFLYEFVGILYFLLFPLVFLEDKNWRVSSNII